MATSGGEEAVAAAPAPGAPATGQDTTPGWEVAVRPLLSASYSAFEMKELPQLVASVIERYRAAAPECGAGLWGEGRICLVVSLRCPSASLRGSTPRTASGLLGAGDKSFSGLLPSLAQTIPDSISPSEQNFYGYSCWRAWPDAFENWLLRCKVFLGRCPLACPPVLRSGHG